MTYCYTDPFSRRAREILDNRIVQLDLAVFHETHDCSCGELLGHGSKLEHCVRRNRRVMFQVGDSISLHLDDLAVFDDHESETGNTAFLHLELNVEVYYSVGLRRNGRYVGRAQ